MVVLDTFDMFSPEYDQPKRIPEVVNWFNRYGMEKVWADLSIIIITVPP